MRVRQAARFVVPVEFGKLAESNVQVKGGLESS
jgi:hypothetical protein